MASGLAALNISSSCATALPPLLTSQFGACANIQGLLPLVTNSGGSLVEPINNYLGGLCPGQKCSDAQLKNASAIIQQGCAQDIQSGNIVASALELVVGNFNDIRNLLCTQYTANGTYCITDILSTFQNSSGSDVSVSQVGSALGGGSASSAAGSALNTSAYCTDCTHAIITEGTLLIQNISSQLNTSSSAMSGSAGLGGFNISSIGDLLNNTVGKQCGPAFFDGQIPSTVQIVGANSTAASA